MTVILPPKMTQRGLAQLKDAGNPQGSLLRASLDHSRRRIRDPRGTQAGSAAGACAGSPAPLPPDEVDLHAAIAGEFAGKFAISPEPLGKWKVTFDGSSVTLDRPPTNAEIALEILSMGTEPANSREGLRGQQEWIGVYFAEDFGWVSPKHDAVFRLIDVVVNIVMMPTFMLKHAAGVKRPYEVEKQLEEVIPRPWHPSWPGGHASAAHALAVVLTALAGADPIESTRMATWAYLIAANRELALVHTRADTVAGRELGQAVGQWLIDRATKQPGCTKFKLWASLWEEARKTLP